MSLRRSKEPSLNNGVGYKLVKYENDKFYSYDFIPNEGFEYGSIGDEIKDPKNGMAILDMFGKLSTYRTGFHIYLSLDYCMEAYERHLCGEMAVIKVVFSETTAEEADPDELYGPVIVARKMILSSVIVAEDRTPESFIKEEQNVSRREVLGEVVGST